MPHSSGSFKCTVGLGSGSPALSITRVGLYTEGGGRLLQARSPNEKTLGAELSLAMATPEPPICIRKGKLIPDFSHVFSIAKPFNQHTMQCYSAKCYYRKIVFSLFCLSVFPNFLYRNYLLYNHKIVKRNRVGQQTRRIHVNSLTALQQLEIYSLPAICQSEKSSEEPCAPAQAVPLQPQAGGEELLANGLGYIFDPIDHLLAWRWIQKLQLRSLQVCCPLAKSPALGTATSNCLSSMTLSIRSF